MTEQRRKQQTNASRNSIRNDHKPVFVRHTLSFILQENSTSTTQTLVFTFTGAFPARLSIRLLPLIIPVVAIRKCRPKQPGQRVCWRIAS